MALENVYRFLFHPCSSQHSNACKALSIVTIVALTILTAGSFLLLFGYVNWKDRQVTVQTGQHNPASSVWSSRFSSKTDLIKHKQYAQLQEFEKWAAAGDWKRFTPEYSHYDWWIFPVTRPSSQHGDTYAVSKEDVQKLRADREFMQNYRRGVDLVLRSWGWDITKHGRVTSKRADQRWQGYGVRLGKMADSLALFGEQQLYKEVQRFFNECCMPLASRYPLEPWVIKAVSQSSTCTK